MATQLLNHLGLLELALAEGASTPNPGGKSVIWSTTASKYLGWNGSSWEALAAGGGGGGLTEAQVMGRVAVGI